MKLAVIADIHSNHLALRAAFDIVDKIKPDGLLFLGDYVSDCPYPRKTTELIYEYADKYRSHFVRGNREDYILRHHADTAAGKDDGWRYRSSGTGSLLYTYDNLTARDIGFFAAMPVCLDVKYDGFPPLTICHGSPGKTKDIIYRNYGLLRGYAEKLNTRLLLCGHSHRYKTVTVGAKKVIFCPSVGFPLSDDRSGTAHDSRFMLLESDGGGWRHKLIPLSYDLDALEKEFYESGIYEKARAYPASVMKSLRERRNYSSMLVELAYSLARGDAHDCRGVLPEKYWERAAAELGINFDTELKESCYDCK